MDNKEDLLSLFAKQKKQKDKETKMNQSKEKEKTPNLRTEKTKISKNKEDAKDSVIISEMDTPVIKEAEKEIINDITQPIDEVAEDKDEFIIKSSENVENFIDEGIKQVLEDISVSVNEEQSFEQDYSDISDDNVKLLKKLLKNDKENEKKLFPLISPNIKGFKGFFIGNEGTNKDYIMNELTSMLFKLGKVKSKEPIRISFGNIPDEIIENTVYIIDDLSNAVKNLFNLEDFSDQASHLQFLYKEKMEKLLRAPKHSYVFLDVNSFSVKGFLSLDSRIRYIFSKQIHFEDLTNSEIYDGLLKGLPDSYAKQLPANYKDKFILYMEQNRKFFPFNNKELVEYLLVYATSQEKFELPPNQYKENSLEESFKEIVGMENAKNEIRKLNQFLVLRRQLEKAGAKLPPLALHMMFLGPAGVGKTTIARVIGEVLFDLGYIKENKFVEVTSKDLIGAYGNQTGLKTNKVIQSALGGVLFVDEAYSLSNSCGMAGAEVIANLIKAMEDFRDELVVMFAGYTLEMRDFIDSNSGIASRISYQFKFGDYSCEELYDIYKVMLNRTNMKITAEAKNRVMAILRQYQGRRNFGNGRFVRNLLQLTLTKHASLELPEDQIMTIVEASIPSIQEVANTSSVSM